MLQAHTRVRLLDILCRAVRSTCVPFRPGRIDSGSADVSPSQVQCNALKMATYLLFSTISSAESAFVAVKAADGSRKMKGRETIDDGGEDSFNWLEHRELAVVALAEVLEVDMSKLWTMGIPDENFISLFCRISYQLLEQPIAGRSGSVKTMLLKLIAVPMHLVKNIETQVVATVMHLLNNYEHTVTAVADLCRMMATEMHDARLATSVLRDAVRIDFKSTAVRNGLGIKHVAAFITELSVALPSLVMQHMSIILPLLDSEFYGLRSAIVVAVGNAIAGATLADVVAADPEGDGGKTHSAVSFTRTRDTLLDVLIERAHDVNSFTRAAVVKVWSTLCEKQVLPLARVHGIVMVAIDRLQDKSVVVRKASMQVSTESKLSTRPQHHQTRDPCLSIPFLAMTHLLLIDHRGARRPFSLSSSS